MTLRLTAVVLLAGALQTSASAQPAITYHKDLPAAEKEAEALRVPAFVVLAKPKVTAPAFSDARIVGKSRSFACAAAPLTPALARRFDLDGEFHILLLDPDGEVAARFGEDVSPSQLWFKMRGLAALTRAGFLKTLDSDADPKAKRAALAGLIRVGATAPDLLPLLAGPTGPLKEAARKALAELPPDAVVAALLDGLKSDDARLRAACHPLAVKATGYKAAPLKVWEGVTPEERAAAWDKWNAFAQDRLYPLNKAVLAFCEKHVGTQVNNGECAMLVIDAYKECKARPMVKSGKTYVWGRELRPGEPVLPGDVVQFEEAKFARGGTYPHHTAVVRKVLQPGKYEILHQNVGGVRKVQAGTLDMDGLQEGTAIIYRPQR